MKVIGLTGSIAMGKSEVARILAAEGLPVFDADAEVHRFYNSAEGAQTIRRIVPKAIDNGVVDRRKLSAHLLASPQHFKEIEAVVHQFISMQRAKAFAAARAAGYALMVYDVPLLFEAGQERWADIVIVVSSDHATQRKRALARDGMSEQKLDMILKRQMPDHEKRKRADYVIENNGSLDELRASTLAVLTKIKREEKS
jgi:dephospho-CoA kinase